MISFAAICPHPTLLIPEIGSTKDQQKIKETMEAYKILANKIDQCGIDTIIVISPHGLVCADRMNIWSGGEFSGNFKDQGNKNLKFEFSSDDSLARKITEEAEKAGIKINSYQENFDLDYGTLVPLYFLTKHLPEDIKIVPINYSFLDRLQHYSFGQIINEVCSINDFRDKKIAIIASGDLSHRLLESSSGREFDNTLIDCLKTKDIESIIQIDENLVEDAGECGYHSILILLGALQGLNYEPKILSYEYPFGIGYIIVNFQFSTNTINQFNT